MAVSRPPKVGTEKAFSKVTSRGRKDKANTPRKLKQEKKTIIFRRELLAPEKLEAD